MKGKAAKALYALSLRVGEALHDADAKSAHHALKELLTKRRTVFPLTEYPKQDDMSEREIRAQLKMAAFILQQYELILDDLADCMHWQGRKYATSSEKSAKHKFETPLGFSKKREGKSIANPGDQLLHSLQLQAEARRIFEAPKKTNLTSVVNELQKKFGMQRSLVVRLVKEVWDSIDND